MRKPSPGYEAVGTSFAGSGAVPLHGSRHQAAGLPQPCLVRFKVFTLDERLILKTLGDLAPPDRDGVAAQLHQLVD